MKLVSRVLMVVAALLVLGVVASAMRTVPPYVAGKRTPLTVTGRKDSGWRSASTKKGHVEELEALGHALRVGGPWPISLDEQVRATRLSFDIERCLSDG